MTKAAELAKMGEVITNGQIGGRRNIAINGAMQISQRATSATAIGANNGVYPTLDRMKIVTLNSAGRLTMTQTADGPSGFANCLKFDCTTADTSVAAGEIFVLQTGFEGQDLQQIKKGTSDAEKVTVSFYVKGNANATYGVELEDGDNSRYNSQAFSVTTDWTRVTKTFAADTTGAFGDDNALSLSLNFWIHGGTTYSGGTHAENTWHTTANQRMVNSATSFFDSTNRTFFITGIQIEVGSVATPFEHRSFGEELALCQRYHTRIGAGGGYYAGNASGSNKIAAGVALPVAMRATPSTPPNIAVHRSGNQSVTCSIDSIALGFSNNTGIHLYARFVGHSVTDENPYNIYFSGVLQLDSEL